MDIEKLVETRFEGLEPKELKAIGEQVGVVLPLTMKAETMRDRLMEKLTGSSGNVTPIEPQRQTTARTPSRFDQKPILTSINGWGGKRWHVTVSPPSGQSENDENKFRLTWEGESRDFHYNFELNIPHPYMEALRTSVIQICTQKEEFDANGKFMRIANTYTPTPRHRFINVSVVPGTEHLPESLCHYWQMQAAKHNNFRNVERRILIDIRADLLGPKGKEFYKNLSNEDILMDILNFLNIEEELAA